MTRVVLCKRRGGNARRIPVLNPRARAHSAARAMKRNGHRDQHICWSLGISRERLPAILSIWGSKLQV